MSEATETLHVTSIAKNGVAVLIAGPSGSGKSDLALRLVDRGAQLISDDYTVVRTADGRLLASAPDTIVGKMEVRGVGIFEFDCATDVPVGLFVDLGAEVQRLPETVETVVVAGVSLPRIALHGLEASAPVKVELALDHIGVSS